jgi:hypothetical protein
MNTHQRNGYDQTITLQTIKKAHTKAVVTSINVPTDTQLGTDRAKGPSPFLFEANTDTHTQINTEYNQADEMKRYLEIYTNRKNENDIIITIMYGRTTDEQTMLDTITCDASIQVSISPSHIRKTHIEQIAKTIKSTCPNAIWENIITDTEMFKPNTKERIKWIVEVAMERNLKTVFVTTETAQLKLKETLRELNAAHNTRTARGVLINSAIRSKINKDQFSKSIPFLGVRGDIPPC